jgi:uncharacterized protein YfaT (DUF1175 family)
VRLVLLGSGVLLLLAAGLVPVRHDVRLERAEGNPVQRVVLRSRSLLGVGRPAWGFHAAGCPLWGSAAEGLFVAPVAPAQLELRAFPGFRASLAVVPSGTSLQGAPLSDQGDREAFRKWFVAILENQLDRLSPAWEPAQRDCAGLLRFAFREAWGPHTPSWKERTAYTGPFASRDPGLSAAGPWAAGFPTPEGWRPFAKGALLRQGSCARVDADPSQAQPGDLLFFCRPGGYKTPDHAMAFVRPDPDGTPVLVYHTGREGSGDSRDAGDMRRVRLDDLLRHADPEFRPQPENPAFLGLYRWTVLSSGS